MIDVRYASERKGFEWFTGKGNMNLGVIRSISSTPGRFDDILFLAGEDEYGNYFNRLWVCTVDPGDHFLQDFFSGQTSCAVLAPGFYRGAYQLGIHHDHEALVQVGEVDIFRDGNKDHLINPDPAIRSRGYFGINIHSPWVYSYSPDLGADNVGNKSAGCTVNETPAGHEEFISLCKRFSTRNPIMSIKVFSERMDGV